MAKASPSRHHSVPCSDLPQPRNHRVRLVLETNSSTLGRVSRWTLGVAAATFLSPLTAQEPEPAPLPKEFFAGRRAALMDQIAAEEGRHVVLLTAGAAVTNKWDTFRQGNEFYYMTGVREPALACLLFPNDRKELLLVQPFSRFTAKWDGARLAPGAAAAERTGFAEVGNVRLLEDLLEQALQPDEAGERPTLWTVTPPAERVQGRKTALTDAPSREQAIVDNLKSRFEGLEIRNVRRLINGLRGVKTPEEIAAIQASTDVACHGIAEAMKSTVPGMFEYQVAAVARYVFSRLGAKHDAYGAIVGGGPNGCILHYRAGNRALRDDDLIVMDYGGTINNYATDVTRTFPANGEFSPAQRKLVEDVCDVQQALVAMVEPGRTLAELSAASRQLLADKGYKSAHGPCHHVGLDVHDQGAAKLEPGMLITVEPGAYLDDQGMGCRIEDVILVTEEGHLNLSAHLPSRPDDIEKLMALPGIAQQGIGLPKAPERKRSKIVHASATKRALDTPATVLLVTSAELAPSWQEFAAWKTATGRPTEILDVDGLERQDGEDLPAAIRRQVLQHIRARGTRFVILGGDSSPDGGVVPHRMTPHRVPLNGPLPTDVYYISEGDWDADGDGIYGDWESDRKACNYTHDAACIARIPVRTPADVVAYTQKVIAYESNYPTDAFATRMLYACPEPHAVPKVRRSWDDTVSKAWPGGDVERWFLDETPAQCNDVAYEPDAWVRALNDGIASKVHMHGHGYLPAWVLANNQTVTPDHITELDNLQALPIITTVSCNTGEFDSADDPSIVEAMLRAPNGGAVAIVAPSRPGVAVFRDRSDFRLMVTEGKPDGTTESMTKFWAHGLGDGVTTGEAFAAVKRDFTERAQEHPAYHFLQCELNLLGDPTLDFRATPPKTPTVAVIGKLTVDGTNRLRVNTDAAGASLCVWKPDELWRVVELDDDGDGEVTVPCAQEGDVFLTVFGTGFNAVQVERRVRSSSR